MPFRKDITGNKSGKLTIVSYSHNKNKCSQWLAKCDCGKEIVVDIRNFNSGLSTSCGCNRKGHRTPNVGHPLYKVWLSMRDRCNNPNNEHFHRYGGRGIKCCERWNNYEVFYSDVVEGYKKGLQLDRYPNQDGNYEPNNFRWATRSEQMQNSTKAKLTSSQVIEIRFSKISAIELSNAYNISKDTVWDIRKNKTWKNI